MAHSPSRKPSRSARRVVVKLGTTLLIEPRGALNTGLIDHLAAQAAALRKQGADVLIVTSGAIGVGYPVAGYAARPKSLPELQAAASVGQGLLMHAYQHSFAAHDLIVGQVLLTRGALDDRERYLNARNTIRALLQAGAVPIINENDTVNTEEICFGDNDQLSALVTILAEADLLILLTDVDGLRRTAADGSVLPGDDNLLSEVSEIDAEIERYAGAGSGLGTGGMKSKVEAARIATAGGAAVVIANGRESEIILRIVAGERIGTRFRPRADRLTRKRHWIAFSRRVSGALIVDEGARAALTERNKSLLPIGVLSTSGDFKRGDAVAVCCEDDREIARGITNYSREEMERIKGRRSEQVRAVVSGDYFEEVIHRDNLVVL